MHTAANNTECLSKLHHPQETLQGIHKNKWATTYPAGGMYGTTYVIDVLC